MEKRDNDSIQAYDTLYTTNQIQILKILLPYCGQDIRRSLAVLIKFLELQYTLAFTRTHPECFREPPLPFSLNDLCDRIKGYCPPQLFSMLEQFQAMQNALQMYEEMRQMMELFQGTDAFQGADMFRDADILHGMGAFQRTDARPNEKEGAAASFENASSPDGTKDREPGGEPSQRTEGTNGSAFPMDLLMGMLSPQQQEMFRMFQSDLNPKAEEPPQEKENE